MNAFPRYFGLTILAIGLCGAPLITPVCSAAGAAEQAAPSKRLLPTDLEGLRKEMGKKVIVEGKLVLAGESKTKTVRYLNFTKAWRESVALVFFVSEGGEAFSMEKLQSCVGKKVRATGVISEYGGNLQMKIDSWSQLQEIR